MLEVVAEVQTESRFEICISKGRAAPVDLQGRALGHAADVHPASAPAQAGGDGGGDAGFEAQCGVVGGADGWLRLPQGGQVDEQRYNRILWKGLMGDRPYPTHREGAKGAKGTKKD